MVFLLCIVHSNSLPAVGMAFLKSSMVGKIKVSEKIGKKNNKDGIKYMSLKIRVNKLSRRHQVKTHEFHPHLKTCSRDFPGGLVVRTLPFQCRGHGFDPWLGN